jgi:hypothetical protein
MLSSPPAVAKTPIYITFVWHMHQPIYWPYESVVDTQAAGSARYDFSVYEIFHTRSGPYTSWPKDAVAKGKHLPHAGAQVSFSGSLIENLHNLAAAGSFASDWTRHFKEARAWQTSLGNPRLDMLAFGYFHPLFALMDEPVMRRQIQLHKHIYQANWGSGYSKGIFPTETAFAMHMVPALVAEGIEWAIVDNIHFDRACAGYPWNKGSSMLPPNRADQRNPDPGNWIQRNDMWAPTKTSPAFGFRPHYLEHIDPKTGKKSRLIAIPAAHYEGNEDGRGGFGALDYERVLSQLSSYNTDPKHPLLVVLHHDGDNHGAGADYYYAANFARFVSWVESNPGFEWTTVQDYLERFPPDQNDVIHVEAGGWSGSGGDPEFLKWNAHPESDGYSADRNSWAVLVAAENRVLTAEALEPSTGEADILAGKGNDTNRAWRFLSVGQTSCYEYWDGSPWDSHPARAANQAVQAADRVLAAHRGKDSVAPTLYPLQRTPYNPGEKEWGDQPESADVTVWTLAYDVSGLDAITLRYRAHREPVADSHRVYAGGSWQSLSMDTGALPDARSDPKPQYRAERYQATIRGLGGVYVDYYVEAKDKNGNVKRSPISHVWIGGASQPVPDGGTPDPDGGTPDPDGGVGPRRDGGHPGQLDARTAGDTPADGDGCRIARTSSARDGEHGAGHWPWALWALAALFRAHRRRAKRIR